MIRAWVLVAIVFCVPAGVHGHSGPPFPVVSNLKAGPYEISLWTDPDATDDGSAAGRFWVTIKPARAQTSLPADTHAVVSVTPVDRAGAPSDRRAEPVNGDLSRQFAALVLDHEGKFAVHVTIDGSLGRADVDTDVDATYDLRPSPTAVVFYAVPFILVGVLWLKLLVRRRQATS